MESDRDDEAPSPPATETLPVDPALRAEHAKDAGSNRADAAFAPTVRIDPGAVAPGPSSTPSPSASPSRSTDSLSTPGGSSAASGLLSVGHRLARRYRIHRFIAAGGMGEVYAARDDVLGIDVALKVLRPDLAARDGGVFERFKREIILARKVAHPNVCRVFDVGVERTDDGELFFLTMELFEAETLSERLARRGRFGVAEARRVAEQIGAALDAAHAAGVIHRDLKSQNVLVVEEGEQLRAVVTDFGIARPTAGGAHTATGPILGTPATMAPEQVRGGPVTPAADVYAFGVVLFEVVTGQLPFQGADAMEVATKRLVEDPPSPRALAPDLPATWERTILRCLARDPAARFAHAGDAARALDEAAAEATAPSEAPARERGRGLRRALAAGVVAIAAVSAYAALGMQRRAAGTPVQPTAVGAAAAGAPAAVTASAASGSAAGAAAGVTPVERYWVDLAGSPRFGGAAPLVTLVEFGDFECPYSKHLAETLRSLPALYGEDLAVVWKDAPLDLHRFALPATRFAREAFAQKGNAGFWAAHDRLFASPRAQDQSAFGTWAAELGLERASARRAAEGPNPPSLEADVIAAEDLDLSGAPRLLINGRVHAGGNSLDELKPVVDEELQRARALVAAGSARQELYATITADAKRKVEPRRVTLRRPEGIAFPSRGDPAAKLEIVELGDHSDPFCAFAEPLLERILQDYKGRVRLVWFDFPDKQRPEALRVAAAARHAHSLGGSGAFWQYHAVLTKNVEAFYPTDPAPRGFDTPALLDYAKEVQLNATYFKEGMDSSADRAVVERQAEEVRAASIEDSSLVIKGRLFPIFISHHRLKREIDRALAEPD